MKYDEDHDLSSIDDPSSTTGASPPAGFPSRLSTAELRRSLEAGWPHPEATSAASPVVHLSGAAPAGAHVAFGASPVVHLSGAAPAGAHVAFGASPSVHLSGSAPTGAHVSYSGSPAVHLSGAAPIVGSHQVGAVSGGVPSWQGFQVGGVSKAAISGAGGVYDESESSATTPLKMTHIGPSLVRAGVEVWLKGLSRFLDPGRLQFTRCLVTMPEFFDPEFAAELSIPTEVGGREAVRRAAAESDVLMIWGPSELGDWLGDCRPALTVFVAHGEGSYTRGYLDGCGPVVDHVVAVSRRVQERVTDGYPTTVIPNGVDSSHLARSLSRSESRARFSFGPDDFVVGYVGRFSPEKRAHRVIEAVAKLPQNFKALLVGWGPLHPQLLDLANRLIPGRFAMTVGKGCFGDYYEAMDALCMVSAEEGYPLVVLEAMMCGRPVIATDVGGVPDLLIDRVNGVVVPGDVESIRSAVLLLQKHPEWARGLAAEAKKVADERGHARRMARGYEDLVHRLWREKKQSAVGSRNGRETNGALSHGVR
ncbi:glycosyltransferase [Paludisphaera borealis]|uniref:GT4 family glycosyltransferase n=1 Tax=Paludisphaera borealis TaxID=1387353 RepID=A0A1U7CJ62_9BACT|nr:glycosyltransferase [Paludisphaera borealis]APW58980.1 GT4 family glycosyltransferase [Paludisphaera borealis]